jgi:hypothetical protein
MLHADEAYAKMVEQALYQLVGGVLILAAVLVASREKRPVLITANAQQTPV